MFVSVDTDLMRRSFKYLSFVYFFFFFSVLTCDAVEIAFTLLPQRLRRLFYINNTNI